MSTYKRIQGNALWIDITCDGIEAVDPVWINWSGTWKVSATIGGEAALAGSMIRSEEVGVFQLRIGPVSGGSAWTALPAGIYILTMEVNNATVDYRQETQDRLVIEPQGI